MQKISNILVANRGEIACRVMASAHAKGCKTVAVYSDADHGARHVAMADRAVHIGPSLASESYLAIDKMIDAARKSGADAVHPGYGFLAENAEFAQACADAGLTFIGPSPEAIRLMGNKAAAKREMGKAGIPCVPGYEGEDQSDATFEAQAAAIGFPIMIKAAAGGGGRGMRLVDSADAMKAALASARSEAQNAFGSAELILEKAIVDPRHVEIQIMGDIHGNVIHFGERDCSVQRRHQKVIEESPCPALNEAGRNAMGEAAVTAAKSIGYVGAGTMEFLLDADDAFYFLEMNTRLQVEHPVTEMVTGVDLVAMQIDVASGNPLPITQDDVQFSGHAMEARLYGEDAHNNFLPQTGNVLVWKPAERPGVRIDHGLVEGGAVTPFYDAMIAKIIAHGETRDACRRKLIAAVRDTKILGITTNKAFLCETLDHDVFAAGEATTAFVPTHWKPNDETAAPIDTVSLAGVLLVEAASQHISPTYRGWNSTGVVEIPISLDQGGQPYALRVSRNGVAYQVAVGDETEAVDILETAANRAVFFANGVRGTAYFAIEDEFIYLDVDGRGAEFKDVTYAPAQTAAPGGDGLMRAPMNGRVILIAFKPGDAVKKDDVVAVIEAMKMENQVIAPMDGVVESVSAQEGDQVDARQVLLTITPAG